MSMMPPPPGRWRLIGFALSAIGAMLFAIKSVLIKLIYVYHVDSTTLLMLRMLLSLPVYIAIGLIEWRRRPPAMRPDTHSIWLACLVGILGFYISSWLDLEGLQSIEAQIERLTLFTYPFLVLLFGRLIFKHPLHWHALAGALISYTGLIVIFGGDSSRLTPMALKGTGLVAAAAATFALYQLFAREMIVKCGATLFTAIAMTAAGVAIFAHFLLTHRSASIDLPAPAWGLVLTLAIFGTILPSFLMSAGTARIGAQGTAIIATLSPVVTIAFAVAMLHEPFGVSEAAGTFLVLAGVGLFSLIDNRIATRSAKRRHQS